MRYARSGGVLLHPLSLDGPWLCGTLGQEARTWIDFCGRAGLTWWQVLPLGPTSYGDSPYQSPSAFALNPYLIDPEALREEGLLAEEDLKGYHRKSTTIEYAALFIENARVLHAAWGRFKAGAGRNHSMSYSGFTQFCDTHASWLNDYALFAAIKESMGHRPWNEWPEALRFRELGALARAADELTDRIERIRFTQYLVWSQWQQLREYARARGVSILGDIPIFAAYDSADVWAHPELFQLDAEGNPTRVAGVPPDYFTATGQLWGNPLYDWKAHARTGFSWWIARVRHTLSLVDALRIDHFRGFEAYWAVPAGEPTAINGRWEKGPEHTLFNALEQTMGDLPIVAEDLGFITPEVVELRDSLGFPGMRILQFAFESNQDNQDYPHHYPEHCVAYTGTHDNDTAAGWLAAASAAARRRALAYLRGSGRTFAWDMIRGVWSSPAMIAIAPMQDFLGLGSEARMNYPGTTGTWWRWRIPRGTLTSSLVKRIQRLSRTYFRVP